MLFNFIHRKNFDSSILLACLYHMLPHLSLFFTFCLLIFSLAYLRLDPLRFQAGCPNRRLNLALVFFCVCLVL